MNSTELIEYEEDPVEFYAVIGSVLTTVMGMLFNGWFLICIYKYTPPPLKTYAVLLFNFALFDFFAAFASLCTMQRVLFSGWSIIYIFNGACQYTNAYICYLFHCFNCVGFAHSQWILLISFVYRYWILVKPSPELSSVVKVCLAALFVSVLALLPYAILMSPSEVLYKIARDYYPHYQLDGYLIGGNASFFDWYSAIAVMYMVTPCPWIYAVILVYRAKTLRYLSESASNLSEATKKSHRKMIKALTIQACIPGFYLLGAAQYALGGFHIIEGYIYEHTTFIAMEFMPLMTPLISLYFITPYRRACMKCLGIKSKDVKPVGAVGSTSAGASSKTAPAAKSAASTSKKDAKESSAKDSETKEEPDLSLLA